MLASPAPTPDFAPLPDGLRAGAVHCGLKKGSAPDLGLLLADEAAPAAAIFTANRLVGAHVALCREHLAASGGMVRAVLVNARNANCATGQQGIADARRCCAALAERLGCAVHQVLMASTGPIGIPLPSDRIVSHLDALLERTRSDGAMDFARAIMTTDTRPKVNHTERGGCMVTGFAKGSGMIHPAMATMLGFLTTDGAIAANDHRLARTVADQTFHRVSVDGDTSPNDSLFVLATARRSCEPSTLEEMLAEVGRRLARQIAADGEGATRLVTIEVRGAPDEAAAVQVGRVIAASPLVKTAIAGRDPNWGRILSAAGRAGVAFAPEQARVWIGPAEVYTRGVPHPEREPAAHRVLAEQAEVRIGIDLGAGGVDADVWTCDLTADYVRINADYRS